MLTKLSPFALDRSQLLPSKFVIKMALKSENCTQTADFVCQPYSALSPKYETPKKMEKRADCKSRPTIFADFCGQREGLFHALFVHKIRRRFGGRCFPSLLRLPWAVVSCFHRNSKLPFHYYWQTAHKQRILYASLILLSVLIKKRSRNERNEQIAELHLPFSPIFVDRGKYFSMHYSYIKLEDDLEVHAY